MSLIIPYEKEYYQNEGSFISPSGNIISSSCNHEATAINFCSGPDFEFLSSIKDGSSYYSDHFAEYQEEYNYPGTKEELDVFRSSSLTPKQLELYKLWCEEMFFRCRDVSTDFMIYMLGYDKVQTVTRRAITTTCLEPHVRFYNYYLMDWFIDTKTRRRYNPETREFEIEYRQIDRQDGNDMAAEEEIKEIRSRVLVKDRHLFLKWIY